MCRVNECERGLSNVNKTRMLGSDNKGLYVSVISITGVLTSKHYITKEQGIKLAQKWINSKD